MDSLAEQVAESVKILPTEQQQEVLHYIEFLAVKMNLSTHTEQSIRPPRMSMEEALSTYAGCLDGGPSDLSTNKAHMKGFGEK